jgi:hypothetical protein
MLLRPAPPDRAHFRTANEGGADTQSVPGMHIGIEHHARLKPAFRAEGRTRVRREKESHVEDGRPGFVKLPLDLSTASHSIKVWPTMCPRN